MYIHNITEREKELTLNLEKIKMSIDKYKKRSKQLQEISNTENYKKVKLIQQQNIQIIHTIIHQLYLNATLKCNVYILTIKLIQLVCNSLKEEYKILPNDIYNIIASYI